MAKSASIASVMLTSDDVSTRFRNQATVADRMRSPALDDNGAAEGGDACQQPDGGPAPLLAQGERRPNVRRVAVTTVR